MSDEATPIISMLSAEMVEVRAPDVGAKIRFGLWWESLDAYCEIAVRVRSQSVEEAIPLAKEELHRITALLAKSDGAADPAARAAEPPAPFFRAWPQPGSGEAS
ncbi:hypothetical protein [Methylobacterium sp. E-046]|uniref:hypothetical protein n=1 Tax=Methylobacterium sp. E-046 TaxID=2836576 RepID=UPI001FB9C4A9|nr:hypothetical protein [Methylobacterium sp. E-046]MCJ2102411.1 hypothetical protein [Methylobacterium sp. E-046]